MGHGVVAFYGVLQICVAAAVNFVVDWEELGEVALELELQDWD